MIPEEENEKTPQPTPPALYNEFNEEDQEERVVFVHFPPSLLSNR